MSSVKLRQISVSLPPELVSIVDVATPTHRSRSVVVAEALQLWLEERGIEPPGDLEGSLDGVWQRTAR